MPKQVLGARHSLGFVALVTAVAFAPPAHSENFTSSSGANVATSSAATTTNVSTGTNATAGAGFIATSNAAGTAEGGGTAAGNSSSYAQASATVAGITTKLTIAAQTHAAIASIGSQKDASGNASATGTIGAAAINNTATALAVSGPGQITAAAKGSDGSFAIAAVGAIYNLNTYVPGGVTKVLHSGASTESITCNAGGSCSQAKTSDHSVSAGLHIVTTSGIVSAAGVDAILRSVLNVEAGAGWSEVNASATSNIFAKASSNHNGNAITVNGNLQNWSVAAILHPVSKGIENGAFGGENAFSSNVSVSQRASVAVWQNGNTMCVSTNVRPNQTFRSVKVVTKCRRLSTTKRLSSHSRAVKRAGTYN